MQLDPIATYMYTSVYNQYLYTLQPLRHHGSMTRRSRPLNTFFLPRRGSFKVPARSDSISTGTAALAGGGHRRSLSSQSSLNSVKSLPGQLIVAARDFFTRQVSRYGSMDAIYNSTLKVTSNVVKKSTSCEELELKLLFASCKLYRAVICTVCIHILCMI